MTGYVVAQVWMLLLFVSALFDPHREVLFAWVGLAYATKTLATILVFGGVPLLIVGLLFGRLQITAPNLRYMVNGVLLCGAVIFLGVWISFLASFALNSYGPTVEVGPSGWGAHVAPISIPVFLGAFVGMESALLLSLGVGLQTASDYRRQRERLRAS